MKKILTVCALALFLAGCATYKFRPGEPPYDKGYIAARDTYTILEYTVGKDNSVPDLNTAKERFRRRKNTVEHYYKKMGYIENRFKMAFIDPCVVALKFMGGIFRLPAIAIADYKYEHNPQYRQRVQQREAARDLREDARISKLKEKLNVYIGKDILREDAPKPQRKKALRQKTRKVKQAQAILDKLAQEEAILRAEDRAIIPVPEQPAPVKEALQASVPRAIIIAKPSRGYSPLRVRFNAKKSHSPAGKIIFYEWDFGDGDKSNKPNPLNTYYSGSFAPQQFIVSLTVQDDKGNTATATQAVEVLNK